MAISVTMAKKLVLQKGTKQAAAKAQRAKLTKKQVAKRKMAKPISGKVKRAKLTKAQIAKRRAKGVTMASVVNKPAVAVNAATVKKKKPARGVGKRTVRAI